VLCNEFERSSQAPGRPDDFIEEVEIPQDPTIFCTTSKVYAAFVSPNTCPPPACSADSKRLYVTGEHAVYAKKRDWISGNTAPPALPRRYTS
jgi:hypothetical protein